MTSLKESAGLGYADDFAGMFRFEEKRAESDDAAYLAYCNENFPSLDDDAQSSLVSGVGEIFNTDTPEQKKHLSRPLSANISAQMSSQESIWRQCRSISLKSKIGRETPVLLNIRLIYFVRLLACCTGKTLSV